MQWLIKCCQACRYLPQSNLPSNVVPLSPSEDQLVATSLQGTWSIKAIAMSEAMQKIQGGNSVVKPIAFDTAVVNGSSYTMTGGNRAATQQFALTKSPETGQIYLDSWGTIIATQGWPHSRPMAGQEGEVVDFVTPFAALRWTRKENTSTATAFGAIAVPGGPGGFCSGCGAPLTGTFCAQCGKGTAPN